MRWASLVSVVHLSLWSADVGGEMRSTSVGYEAAQVLLLLGRKQTGGTASGETVLASELPTVEMAPPVFQQSHRVAFQTFLFGLQIIFLGCCFPFIKEKCGLYINLFTS